MNICVGQVMKLIKEKCYGCTACANSCKKNAIKMIPDEEGFLYPQIDDLLCTECGLCSEICPLQTEFTGSPNNFTTNAYAVRNKNRVVLEQSTSGGAFTAISDYILMNSGVIFGVAFNEHFKVVHTRAETFTERDTLRGVKYVQSDLKTTFKDIKSKLIDKTPILFVGTPCQVDGLKTFLKDSITDNLLTVDIICHGVPSPLIWEKYVDFVQDKFDKIQEYSFRYKPLGWRGSNVHIKFKNGKILENTPLCKTYSNLYFKGFITRPSCDSCKYTNLNRVGDITIGDFWGIEKCSPTLDDNNGVSFVLVNTKKGEGIFDKIKEYICYEKCDINNCIQPNLKEPTKPSPLRKQFWQDYHNKGFSYCIKKFTDYGLTYKITALLKRINNKIVILIKKFK